MFYHVNLIVFGKHTLILNLMTATCSKNVGTGESLCNISLSFNNTKRLSSCTSVQGLGCRILCSVMGHTFSAGDGSGLQAGQASSRALVIQAECGLVSSCWKMQEPPWKRCCLDGSTRCSKICPYLSVLMLPSQKSDTDTPPCHE